MKRRSEQGIVRLLNELKHISLKVSSTEAERNSEIEGILNKLKELTNFLEMASAVVTDSKLHSTVVRTIFRFTELQNPKLTLQITELLISVGLYN